MKQRIEATLGDLADRADERGDVSGVVASATTSRPQRGDLRAECSRRAGAVASSGARMPRRRMPWHVPIAPMRVPAPRRGTMRNTCGDPRRTSDSRRLEWSRSAPQRLARRDGLLGGVRSHRPTSPMTPSPVRSPLQTRARALPSPASRTSDAVEPLEIVRSRGDRDPRSARETDETALARQRQDRPKTRGVLVAARFDPSSSPRLPARPSSRSARARPRLSPRRPATTQPAASEERRSGPVLVSRPP